MIYLNESSIGMTLEWYATHCCAKRPYLYEKRRVMYGKRRWKRCGSCKWFVLNEFSIWMISRWYALIYKETYLYEKRCIMYEKRRQGSVGVCSNERAYSLESSLQSNSSNLFLWKCYQLFGSNSNVILKRQTTSQGCERQTPSATVLFFRTNLICVPNIEM